MRLPCARAPGDGAVEDVAASGSLGAQGGDFSLAAGGELGDAYGREVLIVREAFEHEVALGRAGRGIDQADGGIALRQY